MNSPEKKKGPPFKKKKKKKIKIPKEDIQQLPSEKEYGDKYH